MIAAYRGVLRNSALSRLLLGEFVSSIGDWLYLVALLIVVYQETQSALVLGLVGAGRILPYILLSVPAGMVADRFDRRMVLLVTDVIRGVAMVVLVAVQLLGGSVLVTVVIAVLATCFSVFFGPAIASYLPTLVQDESELGPANSAWATLDNLAFIIGPGIAGVLIAVGGLTVAFALNALTFAAIAVVLWTLPRTARRVGVDNAHAVERGPVAGPGVGDGVPESSVSTGETKAAAPDGPAATPALRSFAVPLAGPVIVDSAISFAGGGLGVMTVILAVQVLGAGEEGTGFLNAAIGVGGLIGGLVAGVMVLRGLAWPLAGGILVAAAGLAGLGLSGSLLPALVAIAVTSGGALLVEVINTTLVQRMVPDEFRGRVMGAMQTVSSVAYTAGAFLVPVTAELVGAGPVLVSLGVLVAVSTPALLLIRGKALAPVSVDPATRRALELPLFAGLPPARIEAAARRLTPVHVTAGSVVIRQGEPADRFYVIADGTYRVTQAAADGTPERQLRVMGPDEVFGQIGLLTSAPRTATVTALTDGRLLALDGEAFLELVASGPGVSSRLLELHRGSPATAD